MRWPITRNLVAIYWMMNETGPRALVGNTLRPSSLALQNLLKNRLKRDRNRQWLGSAHVGHVCLQTVIPLHPVRYRYVYVCSKTTGTLIKGTWFHPICFALFLFIG